VLKILAFVLIVLGVLGLVYKQFNYTRKSHDADLGVPLRSPDRPVSVDTPHGGSNPLAP